MKKYILRRVILMIPLVFGVTTATFALIHLIPGDPVELMMSNTRQMTQEEIDRIRDKLGLNDPLPAQYVRYLTNLLKGDMGKSVRSRSDVSYEILQRLPDTIILTVTSISIVLVFALPIGILSALKRGTWIDTLAMTFALFGVSIPAFWFGIMLMLIFGLHLDWLPTVGQGKTPIEFTRSLILPSVTLSLILLGLVTRVARSSMLEVLSLDYVRTARAKGMGARYVNFRHALPNALIPILTVVSGQFASLLGGAVLIEKVFGWPGIGRLAVDSIFARDYLVVTNTVLVFAIMVILVNLANDILYSYIDPRIRFQ
ncbi:MAG: ABC transporter permease [Chloroflexi bacterium]|nr:ABC transporter permease [Chloroflexota bacterium]MDE2638901.1 ABC transporter permease [Chloroflexota bacterium]